MRLEDKNFADTLKLYKKVKDDIEEKGYKSKYTRVQLKQLEMQVIKKQKEILQKKSKEELRKKYIARQVNIKLCEKKIDSLMQKLRRYKNHLRYQNMKKDIILDIEPSLEYALVKEEIQALVSMLLLDCKDFNYKVFYYKLNFSNFTDSIDTLVDVFTFLKVSLKLDYDDIRILFYRTCNNGNKVMTYEMVNEKLENPYKDHFSVSKRYNSILQKIGKLFLKNRITNYEDIKDLLWVKNKKKD